MTELQQYETRDGVQRLRFEGVELAHSSSQHPGKPRWIEFTLYKTKNNQYVVYRVGRSFVYHTRNCPLVVKNRLSQHDEQYLPSQYKPCQDCKPNPVIEPEGYYPEKPRYYTQASGTVEGVLEIISQRDTHNIKYLTNVAKDLMTQAAEVDEEVRQVFYNGRID